MNERAPEFLLRVPPLGRKRKKVRLDKEGGLAKPSLA